MAAGETIEDLINKAEVLLKMHIHLEQYRNEDARIINKKAQELHDEFLDNIIALSQLNIGQNFDLTPIVQLTEEIKNAKPSGRIVIDLLSEDSNSFLNIRSGDNLIIQRKQTVFLFMEKFHLREQLPMYQ